jgi:hypothetical protein
MRLVVRRRVVMRRVPRAVVPRSMMTASGFLEVLLHHGSAVLVFHELLVGHAVTLPDRAFREILTAGVVVRGRSMMRFRVVAGLALMTRRRVVMRRAVVTCCAVPMRTPGRMVIGIVLPRRSRRIVRERRRQLGGPSRHRRRKLRSRRRRRRFLNVRSGLLGGGRHRPHGYHQGYASKCGTTHDTLPHSAARWRRNHPGSG